MPSVGAITAKMQHDLQPCDMLSTEFLMIDEIVLKPSSDPIVLSTEEGDRRRNSVVRMQIGVRHFGNEIVAN